MKNILDLRFIIGLFFGITGILLVITSFVMTAGVERSEATNFWSGIVYISFGVLMLIFWFFGMKKKVNHEEIDAGESPDGQ